MAANRKDRAQKRLQKQEKVKAEGGLRAVGYIRVSTEEQAENGSGLAYQRAAIEGFAKAQGYRLLEIVEDAGVSGSTAPEKREGFGRILSVLAPEKGAATLLWLAVISARRASALAWVTAASRGRSADGVGNISLLAS